jgi:hypothetical protein
MKITQHSLHMKSPPRNPTLIKSFPTIQFIMNNMNNMNPYIPNNIYLFIYLFIFIYIYYF